MNVFLENEVEAKFSFDVEEVADRLIQAALDYEDFPFEISVEINLVDNEMIRQINKEYRNIDKPTDVLSFPMIDYPAPGDFSQLEYDDSNFDPEDGTAILGNIIISVDKVREQAREYNHSELREYGFLNIHSMLHLFGYDHEDEEEAKEMFLRQEAILEICGITRDL